jgi:Transposase and inactivated derivatives
MTYPLELRQRVMEKETDGLSQSEIAEELSVSAGWVNKVLRCYATHGTLFPPRKKTGPRPKLSEQDREVLRKLVSDDSDQTLAQLAERMTALMGKTVNSVNIFTALKAMGYSHKKNDCAK